MRRWTANFLLLVMLVPGFAPLALASTLVPMHCARMRQAPPVVPPAMHCHRGMGQMPMPESTGTSFRALDGCCDNHDCCRGVKTSEWARPASAHFSCVSLLIESTPPVAAIVQGSADIIAPDTARAPPRA